MLARTAVELSPIPAAPSETAKGKATAPAVMAAPATTGFKGMLCLKWGTEGARMFLFLCGSNVVRQADATVFNAGVNGGVVR